jgi:plasmid replication initiation protein
MGNLIVKSNAFVGASYGLGVVEQRLILLAILKARETDSVSEAIGKTLTIHASDYMTHFGVDRATAYKCLENAVNGLYESEYRFIEILPNGERKTHRERFVSGVAYSDGLGSVQLKFTPETVPLVVGLSKNFTKYEIEQVAKLSSQYALRLYEILSQWRAKGQCTLDLAELRFKFGLLDDEYLRMDNFKRWVLDMAVNEINEQTDLTISYEQHKRGRVITGFTFAIKQKQVVKPKLKDSERDPKTVDIFDGFTDLERQTIQQRIDEHIKRLEQQGETVGEWHRKNIEKKAISERWGLDVLAEKERNKAERKAQKEREKAEQRAEEEQKRQHREFENQRKQKFAEMFENLPLEEQQIALDEVGKESNVQIWGYNEKRKNGVKVHLEPMFIHLFYRYFGIS